jgi:hypothetical protein
VPIQKPKTMKDPAFLFYYQDFLVGTDDMTNEEVGAYIRCLCHQASKGSISEKHMIKICSSHDIHNAIKSKFKVLPDGTLANERLSEEVKKRAAYAESRRNNRRKINTSTQNSSNNISSSYVQHMENENENENEDVIEVKVESRKFKKPEAIDVLNYMAELNQRAGGKWQDSKVVLEAQKFFDFYTSNGWKVGRNSMKDWQATARNWMNNNKPTKTNDNEQRTNEIEYRRANDPNYFKL